MFERKSVKETERILKTDVSRGLSQEEARRRLSANGPNELAEARQAGPVERFFQQLNDPLIYVLLAAAAISLLLHEASDAVIIIAVVLMNAIVGMVQEGKAQKALDGLKRLTSPKTIVKRDGAQMEIPASQLVVGDVVCLDAGRQVPADIRLVETINVKIEESALTGESVPVKKDANFIGTGELVLGDRKNMAFMSTLVTGGRLCGVVTAVAMETEIGKIASMIDEAPKEMTPLQKRLADMGRLLSLLSVFLCVVLFLAALVQGRNVVEMFITAVSLAVAAVPEGLPAIVTIVLALSVSKMVKLHTIVRRLPSVETLGAVSVVCSDKTGTLTQNRMSVEKCYLNMDFCSMKGLDSQENQNFLNGMVLCNDGRTEKGHRIGDPTETALLDAAWNHGVDQKKLNDQMPRLAEKPFDSERKMMTTLHRTQKGRISYTKGAADEVLRRCDRIMVHGKISPMTQHQRGRIEEACETMASQAMRVLAFAMRQGDEMPQEFNMIFLGMTGMTDPVRPEVLDAVNRFKGAGVDTVMITGDHVDTAYAVGQHLGIVREKRQCMSGRELSLISDEELKKRVSHLRVYARVAPEHKVRIVRALKAGGKIVAMTGDGVNDAPSLRAADVGIAMGMTGTDVAKNAADIILADDNFATIERAIEEGRGIYENIKKSVLFLLSSNFGEILTMFLAVLLGMASPLKASHILWINLMTDSLPALALGVDENDRKSLMSKPPRKAKESLFADGGLSCILFYGILIGAISLAAFLKLPYDLLAERGQALSLANIGALFEDPSILNRSQTYAFTVLGLSQLFHAVGMRDRDISLFRMNHLSNKLMIIAFFLGFLLQTAVTEIPYLIQAFGTAPLCPAEWVYLIGLAAFPLFAHEMMILSGKLLHREETVHFSAKSLK